MTAQDTLSFAPLAPAVAVPPNPFARLHLWMILGVSLGALAGLIFGSGQILLGIGTPELGQLGMLVIRVLKALAIPLVLFAILNALVQSAISGRKGCKLLLICLLNVTVASLIALALLNFFQPGHAWTGKLQELAGQPAEGWPSLPQGATLNPLQNLAGFIPASLFQPFLENNLISIVLIALFFGAALRRAKHQSQTQNSVHHGIQLIESFIAAGYQLLLQMLQWVILAVPVAVCFVVAQAVGRSGLAVFTTSLAFLLIVVGGLLVHGLIYYPIAAWVFGGRTPRHFLCGGAPAILTGISTNSSLATVPVTLDCLNKKFGVSESSATLSVCIGTNLNNDGITLYEAMAALFLAQACGMQLGLGDQVLLILASIMAAIGCAGIPEAGLVVLPLVLGAAGLPEWLVAAAIPLLLPIDWFVARVRSAVNVMSDLLVAIMLDGRKQLEKV